MDEQQKPKVGVGVGVMIIKQGQVLLGKRNPDSVKADSSLHGEGTWTMPGGKVHFGETFEDAGIRETMEETGLKINKPEVISLSNDIVSDAHFATVGLLCEDFEGEPKPMEPEVITEWKWFNFNDLPSPLFPPSQKIINNFMDKKFYSL